MTVAEVIDSAITLHGSVRHLLDPKQRQAPWHGDGGEQVMACKRRYWVVWDAQHDRPLCEGCRRWLVATSDAQSVPDDAPNGPVSASRNET